MMNRLVGILLLACSTICLAQMSQIKSGATVYIERMDGYETYLAAAIAKKHVPLIVVADKGKADYFITSSVSQRGPVAPAVVIHNTNVNGRDNNVSTGSHGGFPTARNFGHTSASISVIEAQSSQIVYAYSVGKSANTNQIQSTAEACAKHLKEFIEKTNK